MSFAMRIYDGENRHHQRPGESLRDAAIRRTEEQAATHHVRGVGEPRVERINDRAYGGEGWFVEWKETEPLG